MADGRKRSTDIEPWQVLESRYSYRDRWLSVRSDTVRVPDGTVLAAAGNLYGPVKNLTSIDPRTLSPVGGSQPHNNLMPYLVLNFIIALQGIFPSQN